MDSFTIELVPKASGEFFPNKTLSSFANFLPEQVNVEGQWEVAISETSNPSKYQKITGGGIKIFWRKTFKIYVNLQYRTCFIHFHHRPCGSHEHPNLREKQPQRNLHNSQGVSQNAKSYKSAATFWIFVLRTDNYVVWRYTLFTWVATTRNHLHFEEFHPPITTKHIRSWTKTG